MTNIILSIFFCFLPLFCAEVVEDFDMKPMRLSFVINNFHIDESHVEKILKGKRFHISSVFYNKEGIQDTRTVIKSAICTAGYKFPPYFFSLALDKITDYVAIKTGLFSGPPTSQLWFTQFGNFSAQGEAKVVVSIDDDQVYGRPIGVSLEDSDGRGEVRDIQGFYLVRKPYTGPSDIFDDPSDNPKSATNYWIYDPRRMDIQEARELKKDD